MGKFDGKVLLVLGSNVGSVDIVQYAKSNGAKVLVADYYLMDKSEAKRFSDKNFLVRYPEGSVAPKGDTLRQLMLRFVMVCDNKEKMKKDITYLNEHIFVLNNMGENMVIKPLIDKIVVF